ncbi:MULTISPECIES: acyl carrier protein [unclassified Novosphingobium]|uniref:acyl carrier protein n=1 Tax=unclassified Novosphingobium TaxID=2644732 RepID=UPI0025EAF35B|nr:MULTISPECIES: acyl carrier protein [unclassified Novosphingobium]HQV04692.1 acyl carrier protein [Novosphingobium sp.]
MNEIELRLRDILIDDLFVERDIEQIQASDTFRGDFGIDSLGFVELKTQVETAFAITIPDDDFTPENFATIASLAQLVGRFAKTA